MHPTLSRKQAIAFVDGRHAGSFEGHDLQPTFIEGGTDWVDEITSVLDDVLATWNASDLGTYTSDQARDELEGVLAARLHEGLVALPASVLTDKGFWRYAAAYLYDFVLWRQPSNAVTALHPYFGIASESLGVECVPHRMFDRAHIALVGGTPSEEDPYFLAKFGAADVWKSHIIRTRNSYAPIVVHELLLDVQAGKLKTDPVRILAKNLKRVRSNVLFEVLEQPEARVLLDREIVRVHATLAATLDAEPTDS
jgi:hypothetical protein